MKQFREHALRGKLLAEMQARPPMALTPSLVISHVAFVSDDAAGDADFDHCQRLMRDIGAVAPAGDARHIIGTKGDLTIKWERHTEFTAYTFIRPLRSDEPATATPLDDLTEEWIGACPGDLIAGVHLFMPGDTADPQAWQQALFRDNRLYGADVMARSAAVWTDFREHGDAFGRFLIAGDALTAINRGRLVKRILEIETYRMLTLLALPQVQETLPELGTLDRAIAGIIDALDRAETLEEEHLILTDLTRLTLRLEQVRDATRYRTMASRAYVGIVERRLDILDEQPLDGLQSLSGFIEHRLVPAMDTIESASRRRRTLGETVYRTLSLLRTRIDLDLEEQNQGLLQSMERRSRQQLVLNQAVEGLSVAAITYYAVGLFTTALEAGEASGMPVNATIAGGLAIPVIAGLVWWIVHRTRRHIETL